MNQDQMFVMVKEYLESKPASHQALSHLSPGVEIRVILNDQLESALFYDGDSPRLEPRPALKPDVEFNIYPEGFRQLKDHPGDDMGEFGVLVVKQILQGHIKVAVCGRIMNVLRHGYLKIISDAGPVFMKNLAKNGFGSLPKIISAIKSMRGSTKPKP